MKGIALSEAYFKEVGFPMLCEKFGGYIDRMAVGLVGDGSECFGFDDDLSRDHDWGPGFCLWLSLEDYEVISSRLKSALAALPQSFAGFGPRQTSQWGDQRIGVFETNWFYQKFIGFDHMPSDLNEWLTIPENNLAACTNGKVFFDPFNEFSRRRKTLLYFYPEDVRLKKIAARCMTIGQAGQYNLPRCVKRKDFFCAQYAETKFSADFLSLYLNQYGLCVCTNKSSAHQRRFSHVKRPAARTRPSGKLWIPKIAGRKNHGNTMREKPYTFHQSSARHHFDLFRRPDSTGAGVYIHFFYRRDAKNL